MNRIYAFVTLALAVSGCVGMLPPLMLDPWEHTVLSDMRCPDLSGTYDDPNNRIAGILGMKLDGAPKVVTIKQSDIQFTLEGRTARPSRTAREEPREPGWQYFFDDDVIDHARAEIYRPKWNSPNIGFPYPDGGACGCSWGKYVCQSSNHDLPRYPYMEPGFSILSQVEIITGKDKSGNLEVTEIKKAKVGHIVRETQRSPEQRKTWVFRKISLETGSD